MLKTIQTNPTWLPSSISVACTVDVEIILTSCYGDMTKIKKMTFFKIRQQHYTSHNPGASDEQKGYKPKLVTICFTAYSVG